MKRKTLLIAVCWLFAAAAAGCGETMPPESTEPAASLPDDAVLTVGTEIAAEDLTEFWYTLDASVDPPVFRRYQFYRENGVWMFRHEKREGDHWPLAEADITVSGTVELDEEEQTAFLELLAGGTVRKRTETVTDGDAGPWLYLYWNGDPSDFQEFVFASREKTAEFEDFCASLAGADEREK